MPTSRNDIVNRLARLGALHRVQQMEREMAEIYAAFPELRGVGESRRPQQARRTASADSASNADGRKRKRRRMSASARKAISDAQKKRWAAQKAGKK